MRDKEAADEATRDPNPTIDGRRTNINLAYFGAKNRTTTLPRRALDDELRLILSVCCSELRAHTNLSDTHDYVSVRNHKHHFTRPFTFPHPEQRATISLSL